ncbi:helix-turn-helix domain-containing protein [Haloarcula onubensis]|uniref:Helix-turn-helix domain-containing protein n=1 Tax=Haloarcula onubensis TaxID=2950539 RepID=A0ABU2FNB9_9EURY|nr:helix-turn-helix domain-containing protein [Halomicroarcula sp. S3CR25-11]MDS0282243.1 helix-turn-helix domain-containing protein [Halomicroarcula sp. S3CR25-11]
MSVIAEFTIKSSEFILGQVLARDPGTHVEMERVVPASGRVMPYVWVHDGDFEAFEESVRSSDYVQALTALDIVGESALYRVEWAEDVESLIYGMAETNASILSATGNETWLFRIRFDDHGGLTDFHNFCTDHGIKFQLNRVYTLADRQEGGYSFDLTDAQRRTLVTAVERGYFEVPRRATLGDIGEDLGITEQSVSENVRRGADKVLKGVLLAASVSDL